MEFPNPFVPFVFVTKWFFFPLKMFLFVEIINLIVITIIIITLILFFCSLLKGMKPLTDKIHLILRSFFFFLFSSLTYFSSLFFLFLSFVSNLNVSPFLSLSFWLIIDWISCPFYINVYLNYMRLIYLRIILNEELENYELSFNTLEKLLA